MEERNNKKGRNGLKKRMGMAMLISCGLISALAVGGTMAYLTDNESHTNTFTVGNVKINLEEPSWDIKDVNKNGVPDAAENVVPNQQLAKDPQVENEGNNDAVVFLRVTVPVKDVTKVANDGTVSAHKPQELFYFKDGGVDENYSQDNVWNANWVELGDQEANAGETQTVGQRTYVFGYKKRLAKGATTAKLFQAVQVKNIIENEVASDQLQNVKIEAFAIQADDIVKDDLVIGTKGEMDATTLSDIYDIFVKQNGTIDAKGNMKWDRYQDAEHGQVEKEADTSNTKDLHAQNINTKTNITATINNPIMTVVTKGDTDAAAANKDLPKEGQITVTDAIGSGVDVSKVKVTYTSSDDGVATVDAAGKVTAVSIGDATITCRTEDGAVASVHVSVVKDSRPVNGQVDANDGSNEHTGTSTPEKTTKTQEPANP